jgi:hypothetical protein
MLPGLRSRWRIPCWWAASTASAMASRIGSARSRGRGPAVQELHHEVGSSRSRIDPGVGDLHDVGVPEPAERLGLPLEAAHRERIESQIRPQELEREVLLEPEVGGAVDDARRPLAEAAVQPVLPVDNAGQDTDAGSNSHKSIVARAQKTLQPPAPVAPGPAGRGPTPSS